MKAKKPRRPGATQTFSVSVDEETKLALRALADADFGGNLSALITDLAEDARRRMAAGRYLRAHRIPPLSEVEARELESALAEEAAAARKRPRRRTAA